MTELAMSAPFSNAARRATPDTSTKAVRTKPSFLARLFASIQASQERRARQQVALYAPDLAARMNRNGVLEAVEAPVRRQPAPRPSQEFSASMRRLSVQHACLMAF